MFKVIAKYAPAVAALGALSSVSFGAVAETAERSADLPSVTVRYADLNLNTPAGVETLYSRLRTASRALCNVDERRSLVEVMAAKSCYRQVLATAVNDANLPTLTTLHRVESGRAGRS